MDDVLGRETPADLCGTTHLFKIRQLRSDGIFRRERPSELGLGSSFPLFRHPFLSTLMASMAVAERADCAMFNQMGAGAAVRVAGRCSFEANQWVLNTTDGGSLPVSLTPGAFAIFFYSMAGGDQGRRVREFERDHMATDDIR